MKIENLVPPLELCKLIPAGGFADSVFVWGYSCDKRDTTPFVDERDCVEFCRRNMTNAPPMFPAPTLQEIMADLPSGDTACFCCYNGDSLWSMGNCEHDLYVKNGTEDSSPAAAALKVWLETKVAEAVK